MGKIIGKAFGHIGLQLLYVLVLMPIDIWKAEMKRLASQKDNQSLKISAIKSPFPLFTFLKRWFFEFLFDMIIVLLPVVLWCVLVPMAVKAKPFNVGRMLLALYVPFIGGVGVHFVRDFFALLLLPFSKFISWIRKPAQHLDLTIDKEILK